MQQERTIVVATHNEGKLVEMNRILGQQLGDLASNLRLVSAGSLGLPDPKETGISFEQNALIKARDVAIRTGLPAVADDSGLIVDVLGSAPGILSARWSGQHGDDVANYQLLLDQIQDIPDANRSARFRCAAALVVPEPGFAQHRFVDSGLCAALPYQGSLDTVSFDIREAVRTEVVELGDMVGRIIRAPRGEHGFGYDPIFVPQDQPGRTDELGRQLSSAQMTPEEKNAISHRSKALHAIAPVIVKQLFSADN